MEKITLLELHLDDASFTATANGLPLGGEESDDADTDADDEAGAAAGRGRRLLVALAVLAALAVVARALAGDEALEDLAALDEGAPAAGD